MGTRIENKLVTNGQALTSRIITLRSQSVVPAFAFTRVIKPLNDPSDGRDTGTWSGLGTVSNADEHAIDYEPLGHAMVLMLDSLGGAFHDSGTFVTPEDMSSMVLIEPYDINLEGDDRLKLKPDWTIKKGDLLCYILDSHKEYHECTGIMASSMLAGQSKRYMMAQRFDLDYLNAFNEDDVPNVPIPYK